MLFNSFEFILFAIVFFLLWPVARKHDVVRWIYIIAFSLFFYGWWDWRFIPLMVLTVMVDYIAGLVIHRRREYARTALVSSIFINLSVLGYFKYSYFVVGNATNILQVFGVDISITPDSIILPLGISFYTFQSISYTIDVYRREIEPTRSFLHFFSAISFFPQLVAGPIMRARTLLPQLSAYRKPDMWDRWTALRLLANGFFRKVVIADNLAVAVNDAFAGRSGTLTSLDWWVIITMFAFQIYCDFSGYSNIARGLARFSGYELMLNFSNPYRSTSLREFWSRWHISLSTWFRDYVYIPLGGSRGGSILTARNLLITFGLSGLWHGAGWNFIIWGLLHGGFLVVEHLSRWPEKLMRLPFGSVFCWAIIIVQVWIGWVFFRATDPAQAFDILGHMFLFSGFSLSVSKTACIFLALGIAHELYSLAGYKKTDANQKVSSIEIIAVSLMITACIFLRGPGQEFVYFQF